MKTRIKFGLIKNGCFYITPGLSMTNHLSCGIKERKRYISIDLEIFKWCFYVNGWLSKY